jgi:hypothetical protein
MLRQWLCCFVMVGVFLAPAVVRAQQDQPAGKGQPPTVVVRVKSFDTVVQNIKLLAKVADKAEFGEQLEALIKAQTGPNGLEGIDTKKPIGLYARMGNDLNSMAAVLMVPVSDEKALLKLLENINYKAVRNKDGVYIIQQEQLPVEIGFRLANGYAYVTAMNLDAIDKGTLIPPAKIFAKSGQALVSGSLRIDQIPQTFKDLFLQKMEEEVAKEKKKQGKPGETEAERKVRETAIDATAEMMAELVRSGKEVSGSFTINPTTKMISADMTIDGKKTSPLQAGIAKLATMPTPFTGVTRKGAAMNSSINLMFSEKFAKAFGEAIDEKVKAALEKEANPGKKAGAEMFLKILEPTLKSGQLNGAVSLRLSPGAEEGNGTLVAALKLKDGEKIEQALRKVVADAPPQDREKVKWNVAKAGSVNIHRIDAQEAYDREAQKLFGKSPIYFALAPEALFVAIGKDGESALTKALAAKAAPGPVMQIEAEVGQVVRLSGKDHEKAIAQKIFNNEDTGVVRVTVQGGESLRVHFEMSLSVLQFAIAVDKRNKEVNAN